MPKARTATLTALGSLGAVEESCHSSSFRGFLNLRTLDERKRLVFLVIAVGAFFESYDGALLSLTLKQVQHRFSIPEASLGGVLSIISFGYCLAFLITPLADYFGRRRLLLYTIVGYTVATAMTSVAPGAKSFILFQSIARAFSGAEAVISVVVLAEEMDASVRGIAAGSLAFVGALSWAFAAAAFAFIGVLPFGWRALYGFSAVVLVPMIPLRRVLPETQRFTRLAAFQANRRSPLDPLRRVLSEYPGRCGLMMLCALFSACVMAGPLFCAKYLQEALGWTPPMVSSYT